MEGRWMRELELCVETLQGCEAALAGGADRIELCAALDESGLTPSRGFQRVAFDTVAMPVHVLIRPRDGNFVYSDAEFRMMCLDVDDALAQGAAGVVVGVLTTESGIARDRLATLMRLAAGRPVTFHRAFDHTPDLPASLEILAEAGCDRILTSGGRPTVTEGLPTLRQLAAQAAGRLRIAAGGGVTMTNAPALIEVDGLDLHASLRTKMPGTPPTAADPLWNEAAGPKAVSVDAVRKLSAMVHGRG